MKIILGALKSATALIFLTLGMASQEALALVPASMHPVQYQAIPGQFSSAGPASAIFNSQLFIAYTSTGGPQLKIASSTDGINFSSPSVSPAGQYSIASAGPGLAAFNGRLYIAWTGGSNHINITSSADGVNFDWSNVVTLRNSSGAYRVAYNKPVLLSANSQLYLAWCGTDSNHTLNVATSTDGVNFGNQQVFSPLGSAYSLALTASGGTVFLAWDDGGSIGIRARNLSTGAYLTSGSLSSLITIGPHGPGVTTLNNTFLTAFAGLPNGLGGGSVLYYSSYPTLVSGAGNASPYQPISTDPNAPSFAVVGNPEITAWNGHLFIYYTAASNDQLSAMQLN